MKKVTKLLIILLTLCTVCALVVAASAANNTLINPELIFNPQTTLSVFVDGEADDTLTGNYPYGESVTISAPAVSEKNFQYWTNAEGTVISYSQNLTLKMYSNTTVKAEYGASQADSETVAAFLNVTRTDGEIIFNAIASSGNAGIRYSTTKKSLDEIKGETDVTVVAADETPNWTLVVTPESEDTTYYALAYTTVGTETTYSDVKAVKLSELQNGISMVTNLGDLDLSALNAEFCVVSFDPNGGEGVMAPQGAVKGEETVLNANTFTREGYTFNGWSTNQNGGGTTYTDGQTVTLTANTTLYAQWKSNSSGNGGYAPSGGGNGGYTPSSDSDNSSGTPSTSGTPTSETHTSETATAADGASVTTELNTSSTTTKNSDGSVTVTDKATETVKAENKDGSTLEVKTDKTNAVTTDSKKNADGSVTDTTKISNTETVTQTATDQSGSKTITETKTEQDHNTAVTTKDNADGSKTEKTETTETVKVVEQVKTESGKVLSETFTETTTETKTDMTTAADGTATGTSTSTTTVKDDKGKVLSTAVTEAEIKATTDANGMVTTETAATTTTTDAAGNETVEKTVTTENKTPDGSTGTVVKDESGNILSQETTISQKEAEAARDEGRPAQSPLVVTPVPEAVEDSARSVQVNMPAVLYDKDGDGIVTVAEMPKVEIQVTYSGPGVVAKEKDASGNLTRITECYEGSVIVPVTGTGEIVIVDNTKTFNDVAGSDWYSEYVTFVTAREIFNGTGSGNFAPNETMNRAMLAQVLYNFARGAKAGDGTAFADVSASDWFNAAVGWAYEHGVVTGYGGTFGAQNNITRQDMATILYRYAKQAGYDVSKTASLDRFSDAGSVADYAVDAMRWAVGMGLIEGSNGKLNPTGNATRAQVAAIMTRFVRKAK